MHYFFTLLFYHVTLQRASLVASFCWIPYKDGDYHVNTILLLIFRLDRTIR